ncbi:MAG: serine hydrolase domain-containing protein [Dehalococcoidia bacterium]|nr:serine hydrolase domain-containing protein [Dehalococcoidia bacterium]
MTSATRSLVDARPEDVGMSSQRLARMSRLIERYIEAGRYPGAISMVARRDRVVHFETYGIMDDEAGKAMQPDTIVRAYSMTKPIASVGLMQLYEESLFQLDDPVSAYVPAFRNQQVMVGGTVDDPQVRPASREMTIRDVLMHTSGLVQRGTANPIAEMYARAGVNGNESTFDLAEMVRRVGPLPLYCDPGSAWNYSISTDVVGYLCEVFSGQRLDDYLRERIFEPLGMPDTGFHVREGEIDRLAACYERDDSAFSGTGKYYRLQDAPEGSAYTTPRTYFAGAGGLVTTAADYMRFSRMLANGGSLEGERTLGPRTLEYMRINHLPNGTDLAGMGQPQFGETTMHGVGFGLGFAVLLDPTKSQVMGTPGEFYWGGAASTAFFINPAEELAVVFLTQLRPSSSYPIRRELRIAAYQAITD